MNESVPYTRLPRPTLWLLRGEDDVRPFYLSKNPITNEEFEAYDPSHVRGPSSPGDLHPVVNVSFDDAAGYCQWYARASGKPFRLLSEIEWEQACRAEQPGQFFWGDDAEAGDPYVWDERTSGGRCRPVETSKANGFGLYDTLGNVWEWTSTPFSSGSPDGPRAVRGGSFRTPRAELSIGARMSVAPGERRDDLGFRIGRFL